MIRVRAFFIFALIVFLGAGCSSVPEPKITKYAWPKGAYIGEPKTKRKYEKLGLVSDRVDFPSFHPKYEEAALCKNFFNKVAGKLLKRAKDQGGDAVIDVRSVVFLIDGRRETYQTAECSDEGGEGQVLAQGIAIKWVKEGEPLKPGEKNVFVPPQEPLKADFKKDPKSEDDADDEASPQYDESDSKSKVPRPNAPVIPPQY